MSHIFISYASPNRAFALRLADNLDRFFDVWIDREGLEGGVAWENRIDQAIKDCGLFLVIVSPESNDSSWVHRETLRAQSLKKPCVPALLQGELPLRLLELQYVDFRGEYEGGFRDLLEALQMHLKPAEYNEESVNELIGAAVRAYFAGEDIHANNITEQIAVLDPSLASKLAGLWQHLGSRVAGAQAANASMNLIKTVEFARKSAEFKYDDQAAYEWEIALDAPPHVIEQIEFVNYKLHPTFEPPSQIVRNRESNFRLKRVGWGVFPVTLDIHFRDGSIGHAVHKLTFATAR